MVTEQDVMEALEEVEDPEMHVSVVELGLIYGVEFTEKDGSTHCEVEMTLTSPGCPLAPEIMAAIHSATQEVEGVDEVGVKLVWTPRWDPKIHASEDVQMDLGLW